MRQKNISCSRLIWFTSSSGVFEHDSTCSLRPPVSHMLWEHIPKHTGYLQISPSCCGNICPIWSKSAPHMLWKHMLQTYLKICPSCCGNICPKHTSKSAPHTLWEHMSHLSHQPVVHVLIFIIAILVIVFRHTLDIRSIFCDSFRNKLKN